MRFAGEYSVNDYELIDEFLTFSWDDVTAFLRQHKFKIQEATILEFEDDDERTVFLYINPEVHGIFGRDIQARKKQDVYKIKAELNIVQTVEFEILADSIDDAEDKALAKEGQFVLSSSSCTASKSSMTIKKVNKRD